MRLAPRLSRFLCLLLAVAAVAVRQPASGQAMPQPGHASGFVEAGGRLYHFEVQRDSFVVLGEGVEGRPRVVLPYRAFAAVLARAERAGALPRQATAAGAPVSLGVDDRAVVRLATAVPAGELALWLLAIGVFALAAGAVVWERRARRGQTVRTAFRRRLAAAREAERASVARELHDGPVQDLCAVQMALGGHPGGEAARASVTAVVAELRALCEGLRPSALDAFGLPAALASLADRAAEGTLDVRFQSSDHAAELAAVLDADRQLALYRIAQEALHNAVQHAHARRVDVSLVRDGARLTLAVDDDGVGPPAEAPLDYAARGHYGLLGMQERADLLRARLALGVSPLGGTRVAVELHVPAHRLPDPADA